MREEKIHLEGHLQIKLIDAQGKIKKRIIIRNVITFDGELSVLNLWAQNTGSPTDWQIQQLRVGASATPPIKSDTGLGSPYVDVMNLAPASRIINPSTSTLTLTGSLGPAILTGNYLREVGIFTGNGKMLARQVHPEIFKTGPITASYEWALMITS